MILLTLSLTDTTFFVLNLISEAPMAEIDEFCKPYNNPRTKKVSSGGAARNGRIKTLGGPRGLTAIIEK